MDIQARKIARNYAQAFLNSLPCSLSMEEYALLQQATRSLQQSRQLTTWLKISLFQAEIKKRDLLAWFAALHISCDIAPLLDLLAEHQRLFLFVSVLEQLCSEYAARNGIVDAEVQSTYTLENNQRSEIRGFLERSFGKQVHATFVVKKKLLAGVRLQGTNFLWEHSLRQRLHVCARKIV